MFDIFNSKGQHKNKFKNSFGQISGEYIVNSIKILDEMRYAQSKFNNTLRCLIGWRNNVKCLLGLTQHLKSLFNLKELNTHNLSQDVCICSHVLGQLEVIVTIPQQANSWQIIEKLLWISSLSR